MASPAMQRLGLQLLFAAVVLMVIFLRLLPIDLGPSGIPGPDWPVLLAFVWVLRRPDMVPVMLVAALLLLCDLLFMRPPGLWTAATVLGLEFLRARVTPVSEMPFALEWATVAGLLLAMHLGASAVLALFFTPQPPLGLQLIEFVMTVLFYPLVVVVSQSLLGVRRVVPGELEAGGRTL